MKSILITALFLSTSVFANLHFAPNSFSDNGKTIIFSDFENIDTLLTYDLASNKVLAQSLVKFKTVAAGHVAFDLKAKILSARINGTKVSISQINSPDKVTIYQLIEANLPAGEHELIIENEVDTNIKFSGNSVQSAFWMSDLSDRKYIEQYLPTNLEFDQYQQNLEIKLVHSKNIAPHEIFTNGELTKISNNHFKIIFPDYFTTSSFYFHLSKEDQFPKEVFNFNSISGKTIPVVVYSKNRFSLNTAKKKTLDVLNELEQKLGAWSHPSLTIYLAGMGGMEHSGATMTSMSALGHEITHSFFARGVMPADGNSGWMDEAIASWRDKGYQAVKAPNFNSTQMSGHSQYKRTTDQKAYTEGANFMAFLNERLSNHGGLINFLNKIHGQYVHNSITTKIFKKELELFTGEDFSKEFNQYIFGTKNKRDLRVSDYIENPNHPKLTKEQLESLL